MIFNYDNLKEFIKTDKRLGSLEKYAEFLGVSRVSLSYKLNNKRRFSVEEIEMTRRKFGLSMEQVQRYFFCERVDKRQL